MSIRAWRELETLRRSAAVDNVQLIGCWRLTMTMSLVKVYRNRNGR